MKCTILKIPFNFFCVFLIIFSVSQLSADRVSLKSGKVIENVKTSIEKTAVKIKYENGKSEALAKSDIKSLKITAVEWKTKTPTTPGTTGPTAEQIALEAEEEKARVAIASERGDEFTPRAEEEMVSPWGNFALGLIPGYSGLYRTQSTGRAITFSILETIAFLNFVDVMSAKKTAHQVDAFDVGVFAWYQTSSSGPAASSLSTTLGIPLLLVTNVTNAYGYESGLSGRALAEQAGNNKAKAQLANQQATAAGILGFLLLTDAVSSYFAAESWNEGTYGGEKSDANFVRPTKPSSRLLRSAFLPGWGQVYAGDSVKGYTWMASGLALFGYVVSTEQSVQSAYTKFKRDGYFSVVGMPLLSGTLGLTNATTSATDNLLYRVLLSEVYQSEARSAFESAVDKRNQAWSLYGVFWALNLVDAYFFSGKSFKQEGSVRILPEYSLQPVAMLGNQVQNEHKLNFTLTYTY
ncbi:hypothetical protein EHQ58_05905 [Leptospira ognonensis]|uniref:DUF5683 domain-containing protein n=1 Tax=Leptospira ognonensis TaxID=2484945 RepID=A0A4R9K566_9LEPT|nr:DUF5683 domain-containing protein [Leptospira ognonensis]TGL61309.1 hypothetical protein EHQ58_05905 [Leptospira ognonensis]